MKNSIASFILIMVMVVCSQTAFSQPPLPPDNHGASTNQPANAAPLSGGLFVLLSAVVIYGLKKMYDLRQESLEE